MHCAGMQKMNADLGIGDFTERHVMCSGLNNVLPSRWLCVMVELNHSEFVVAIVVVIIISSAAIIIIILILVPILIITSTGCERLHMQGLRIEDSPSVKMYVGCSQQMSLQQKPEGSLSIDALFVFRGSPIDTSK